MGENVKLMGENLKTTWHVYCDESRTTQHRFMVFGGLVVRAHDVPGVLEELSRWRNDKNMTAELKWRKTSRGKYEEYRSLVDFFFDKARKDTIHFKAVVFDAWDIDHGAYSDDKELGFYKFFYQFLLHRFGPYVPNDSTRMLLYMHRRVSSYPLEDLRSVLNNGMRKHYERRSDAVRSITAVDAKSHPAGTIVQLADVLMGAVGWHWNNCQTMTGANQAKADLADHIAQEAGLPTLATTTPRNARPFNIWKFRLRKKTP